MRNFELIPDSFIVDGHNDIDLLTNNYDEIQRLSNATPVFKKKYRVQNVCTVGGEQVKFDFRYVGDGYYDEKWEKSILKNRVEQKGVYIPAPEDYGYMILYHALVQKWKIAENYQTLLNDLFGVDGWNKQVLDSYLRKKGYSYSEPKDISVVFNSKTTGRKASLVRRLKVVARKVRRRVFNDWG